MNQVPILTIALGLFFIAENSVAKYLLIEIDNDSNGVAYRSLTKPYSLRLGECIDDRDCYDPSGHAKCEDHVCVVTVQCIDDNGCFHNVDSDTCTLGKCMCGKNDACLNGEHCINGVCTGCYDKSEHCDQIIARNTCDHAFTKNRNCRKSCEQCKPVKDN